MWTFLFWLEVLDPGARVVFLVGCGLLIYAVCR